MPRSAKAKQLREELRRAEWLHACAGEAHRRVSNTELVEQHSFLAEKLGESEEQASLHMSIAFRKFRRSTHSRSYLLELVKKCENTFASSLGC